MRSERSSVDLYSANERPAGYPSQAFRIFCCNLSFRSGRSPICLQGSLIPKMLPGIWTLMPTLFSACLRRCMTIAFFVTACTGYRSALAINCKIIAAYTPSEADQAFLHSDYDRAATLYQAQLQQKPNDPELTASLAQVFLRRQKVKE